MSSVFRPDHPDEFHSPGWDDDAKRPIVDGKYNDPATGELRSATGYIYAGPPAVDMVIMNLHESSNTHIFRAQRSFPVEKLLFQIMRVVHDRELEIDSINATAYAIRIVLAHELTSEEFAEVYQEMANGMWQRA
ncbi:hypothetical protein PT974_05103 [Cladobotryum mycophilum]|uniref:Uncharacterized protein n=1 Tax=Cladobotryum mycophilum TaxID=491253 RepID=A0ABR0SRR5_9HYPO